MLIENILNYYKKDVQNQMRTRKQSIAERGVVIAMLVAFAIAVFSVTWFQGHNQAQYAAISYFIFAIFEVILISVSEHLNGKAWDIRFKRYEEKLDHLENMLKTLGYDSDNHINAIIEWCTIYSKTDSFWVKAFIPLRMVGATILVPIVTLVFKDMYQTNDENKFDVIFLAVLLGCACILFSYCIIPAIKIVLNRKNQIAAELKIDLEQLKFRRI